MHDFRRLDVWRLARELFVSIDRLTRSFPRMDRGVLARQLRRSAFAIPGNIAEGCGKSSVKELLRFLDIAAASVSETENHLQIAVDLGYIHPKAGELLRSQAVTIRRMLFRLMEHYARGPGAGEQ